MHVHRYKNERCIVVDESGNFGKDGRYFVIACIDTGEYKSIYNIMKKIVKNIRKEFINLAKMSTIEIKASNSNMDIKSYVLYKIIKKDFKISYIVIDLKYIDKKLLCDSNLMYNYALKLLLNKIIVNDTNEKNIHIFCDNKTIKNGSINTLEEYLKMYFLYEKKYKMNIDIKHIDSNAKNGYCIQAIDFIANAIYAKYEKNKNMLYDIIKCKMDKILLFPKYRFGC